MFPKGCLLHHKDDSMSQAQKPFYQSFFGHLNALLLSFSLALSVILLSFFQGISDLDQRLVLARQSRETQSTQTQQRTVHVQRSEWLSLQAERISKRLRNSGIRNVSVYKRVKSLESATEKIRRKGLSSPEELNDLFGMRIVVDNEFDVYRSLDVLCRAYEPVPGTLKNYIANPKPSGYQSVHIVSKIEGKRVEFQLRTHTMHEQAEAEHDAYKKRVCVA